MARMCASYADAMDCDKQECCESPMCWQRRFWLDEVAMEANVEAQVEVWEQNEADRMAEFYAAQLGDPDQGV